MKTKASFRNELCFKNYEVENTSTYTKGYT